MPSVAYEGASFIHVDTKHSVTGARPVVGPRNRRMDLEWTDRHGMCGGHVDENCDRADGTEHVLILEAVSSRTLSEMDTTCG